MKPQTHSASSPRRPVAPAPRSRASSRAGTARERITDTPRARATDLDLDFHSLNPQRCAPQNARASLHLVPAETEADYRAADPFDAGFDDHNVPGLDDEFDGGRAAQKRRAPKAKTAGKARRFARMPCAPCHLGLLLTASLLLVASLPLVFSASTALALDQHQDSPYFFLVRQFAFVLLGFGAMIGASRISPAKLRGFAWVLYGVAVAGLLATKFSPLGLSQGNTERWLRVGPIQMQFSELAKIALIGVLADFWGNAARDPKKSLQHWAAAGAITAIPLFLTLMQPHLSAAIVLAVISLAVAFFAGAPLRYFPHLAALGIAFGLVLVLLCRTGSAPLMKPYQQQRIAAHFGGASASDSRTSDYQALQGERAIMRGGVRGVGLGASLYKQGHLPAAHTDFIYAVVGEELGMFGTLGILALYGALLLFCFQTGYAARNSFEALLCAGIGTLFGLQAAGNIGVVSGLLPVTGMPLPILTYGGSGLICAMMGIGLVLAVSRSQCESE